MMISKLLSAAAQRQHQQPLPKAMTAGKAAETLGKYFSLMDTASGDILGPDGKVSKQDLMAILSNPGAPQELKDAAKFFLQNKSYFNQVDTGGGFWGIRDGLMSREELSKFARAEAQRTPANPTKPASNGYKPGSSSSCGNASDVGKLLQQIAKLLGADQKAAGATGTDNNSIAGKPKKKMNFRSAMETMKKHFSTLDNAAGYHWQKTGDKSFFFSGSMRKDDGLVTKKDLQAILRDPDQPQELRDACAYMLNHPELFGEIDGATAMFGFRDGLIDRNDLDKVSAKYSGNG